MIAKIRQAAIGVVASLTLITGFMVAPASMLPGSLGTNQASAACSTSQFRITWGQVGVRQWPSRDAYIVAYGYYGQYVYGPTGGTNNGWTYIRVFDGHYYVYGYIPQDSRVYTGCF